MELKLEVGRYYEDRTGKVHGPIEKSSFWDIFKSGMYIWFENGRLNRDYENHIDLIKEHEFGPVKSEYVQVRKVSVLPGNYDKLQVLGRSGIRGREGEVEICLNGFHTADDLRNIIKHLDKLADALDYIEATEATR